MRSTVTRGGGLPALRALVFCALTACACGLLACGPGEGGEDVVAPSDAATGMTDGAVVAEAGAGDGGSGTDSAPRDAAPLDPYVSDFSLRDVNPNSATRDMMISPQRFRGDVSAWYFATALCHECTVQFGYLDMMQRELDAMTTRRRVHIAGIADPVSEGLTNLIVEGTRRIPMLQDTNAMNVKGSWGATVRDVMILDDRALRVGVFNLTENSLAVPANYARLRTMLLEVANR